MSARTAGFAATSTFLAILALAAVEAWMIAVTLDRPAPDQWGFRGFEAVLALSFGSVGALVAARRPENRVGWLVLGLSVVTAAQGLVDQYPVLAEATIPALAFAEASRWVASWIWVISSVSFVVIFPLIFPDGRLLSRRWRLAVLLGFVVMAVQIGSIISATRPLGPLAPTVNITPYMQQIGGLLGVGYVLYLTAAAIAAAAIVLRYRRSQGEVRQQIKWVAYAMVVTVLGAAVGLTPIVLGQVVFVGTGLFAAAAIGIAILRYRLYEIDVIINRTLVYGALSAILAGVYTASITLSQRLFIAITGERSDAAIVFTTLVVVSLFTPLKARLQAIVDRHARPTVAGAVPAAPPNGSGAEALQMLGQLAQLRDAGVLSRDEFRAKKVELLRRV